MINMKEVFKLEWKNLILVLAYIIVAELVYITLMVTVVKLWYVALIVGIAILLIGLLIGYLYIKSDYRRVKEDVNNKVE